MVKKIVVADASPLIAFGNINRILLLSKTIGSIIAPDSVADECLKDLSRSGALAVQKAIDKNIIKVLPDSDKNEYPDLTDMLDKGEAAAITLAIKLKVGLLIDEKMGRKIAAKLNLKIMGTAGVLLLAKQKKLINKVAPLIYELRDSGYYISNHLIASVLSLAKEKGSP